mgnify:CR=1 FL=1
MVMLRSLALIVCSAAAVRGFVQVAPASESSRCRAATMPRRGGTVSLRLRTSSSKVDLDKIQQDAAQEMEKFSKEFDGKKKEAEAALEAKKHEVEAAMSEAALEAFKRFDAFRDGVLKKQRMADETVQNAKAAFERFDTFLKSGAEKVVGSTTLLRGDKSKSAEESHDQ